MTRTEQYRANADECERQASLAHNPRIKAQFVELASQWRQLAGQLERIAFDRKILKAPMTARFKQTSE